MNTLKSTEPLDVATSKSGEKKMNFNAWVIAQHDRIPNKFLYIRKRGGKKREREEKKNKKHRIYLCVMHETGKGGKKNQMECMQLILW